jgi:hypothetical protein
MSCLQQRSGESPKFWSLRGDRTRESLSLAWIGRTPPPSCRRSQPLEKCPSLKEETRFRGGILDKGDVSPNAQVRREGEGLILAWPWLGQGCEEEQNGGGDSLKPEPEHQSERRKGLKPGPVSGPWLPRVRWGSLPPRFRHQMLGRCWWEGQIGAK